MSFVAGQQVRCVGSRGVALTTGKIYTVIEYVPQYPEEGGMFTWPAYVCVKDDRGKVAYLHADRFEDVNHKEVTRWVSSGTG